MDTLPEVANAWRGWEALTPVVRYANFYDAEPGGGFGPRYISDFQLLAVQAGEGTANVDDSRFEISEGDVVFYGPNHRHQVISSSRAPLRLLGLHFLFVGADAYGINADLAAHVFTDPVPFDSYPPSCPLVPNPPAWLRPRMPDKLHARFEAVVLSHIISPQTRLLEKRGLLLQLVEAWHEAIEDRAPGNCYHPAVTLACTVIANNPAAEHTSTALADETSLSADHFGRLFKQQTGKTVREYVVEQRLAEARRMLVQGKHNVAEVANLVGYQDPFYFSRLFRAAFGVAPSRFRAQYLLS